MKQGQFPEIIQLSTLNGHNGYQIYGSVSGINPPVQWAGDINHDGIADMVLSSQFLSSDNLTLSCYVLFGGSAVGKTGWVDVSHLNGSEGFLIQGEAADDDSGEDEQEIGISPRQNWDFNGDGYTDMVIGAPASSLSGRVKSGRAYVVYGRVGLGQSGMFNLSSLNGTNGFRLDGEESGDNFGVSVSGIGDVNQDGYPDVGIGARYALNNAGRSYIVFGGKQIIPKGLFNVTDLNGFNGFKLNGEYPGDESGFHVRPLGDINADGVNDLFIGAIFASPNGRSQAGRSYVLFGRKGIGSMGQMDLGSLNGSEGFKINGEIPGDLSGRTSCGLGDFNGDGYSDFALGAQGHNQSVGRSYVIFGHPDIGKNGTLELSSINGNNGFKIDGENPGDLSGYTLRWSGDINGDHHPDLVIGAYGYDGYKGRAYVVFGGSQTGNTGLLNLGDLNGANGFKIDGKYYTGIWVSGAGDVNVDGVDDLIVHSFNEYKSYVVFGDALPIWVNNYLVINQGQTVAVTSDLLRVIDANHVPTQIFFQMSNLYHGEFLLDTDLLTPVTSFTQQDVDTGRIYFRHDNSAGRPDYTVAVNTTGIAFIPAQRARIDFDANPVLRSNTLCVAPAQTVLVDSQVLKATQPGNKDENLLQFHISDLQHGYFSWVSAPAAEINNFYQYNISYCQVQFTHDSSAFPPAYQVVVTDNRIYTNPAPATVIFKIPLAIGQFPPAVELSSLNGLNGFKINGEVSSYNGWSVSGAGDVNGDGYDDILIGAWAWQTTTGRSYVDIWQT